MVIFAIGDIVADCGCNFLRQKLPTFKKLKGVDFCIANGENSAQGNGITPHSADFLFDSGVDFITTGNHVFRRREIYDYLDGHKNIIRPANYYTNAPGKGFEIIDLGYTKIAVINLSGRVYMDLCENPFETADSILNKIDCKIKIVDFHAEASAEKAAMGYFLDGRVSAVFGTHTHIQTNDAKILSDGTGYITDLGMTGPSNSVLGVKKEISISFMRSGMPARFDTADGPCKMSGCLFEIDNSTGVCVDIEPVNIE